MNILSLNNVESLSFNKTFNFLASSNRFLLASSSSIFLPKASNLGSLLFLNLATAACFCLSSFRNSKVPVGSAARSSIRVLA